MCTLPVFFFKSKNQICVSGVKWFVLNAFQKMYHWRLIKILQKITFVTEIRNICKFTNHAQCKTEVKTKVGNSTLLAMHAVEATNQGPLQKFRKRYYPYMKSCSEWPND